VQETDVRGSRNGRGRKTEPREAEAEEYESPRRRETRSTRGRKTEMRETEMSRGPPGDLVEIEGIYPEPTVLASMRSSLTRARKRRDRRRLRYSRTTQNTLSSPWAWPIAA